MESVIRVHRWGGYTASRAHLDMQDTTAGASERPRVIDTRGEEPLGTIYAAVVATEVVVLAGLWLFSRYFSG